MNRTVSTSFTILCLLSTVLMGFAFNIPEVKAPIDYRVHNLDTGLNYTTIQAAINANQTLDGHTIFVEEGVYYENVVVNKTVSLIGENKTLCVIDAGGIGLCVVLVTKNNVNITGFTIQNSGGGIVVNSSNNRICGNRILRNEVPIYLEHCSNTMILANHISNNKYGIYFNLSRENTISANNISNNTYFGVAFVESFDNTVSKNIITNSSEWWALCFVQSSNNTVSTNNVTNNFWSVFLNFSSNNKFYHNNFIENPMGVATNSINTWNNSYPSGGNYWSDYIATANDTHSGSFQDETGSDGIGDTAYTIDANNADNYPLMGMFHSFNTSLGRHVNVVSNSTIEDFEYFESNSTITMHVSNMTIDQAYGFCRVCIHHDLMFEPYNVTVNGANPTYWNYTLYDNGTHRWIYFSYEHSTLEIIIIPEFPSLVILPIFMISTLLIVIVFRRKHIIH